MKHTPTTGEKIEDIVADVFAMMGGCAQASKGGAVQDHRKKRYEPKTEFGRRLETTVKAEIDRLKAGHPIVRPTPDTTEKAAQ